MLAFAVVVRGRKNIINVSFGVFALMIGSWSAGYCLWQVSTEALVPRSQVAASSSAQQKKRPSLAPGW